MNNPVLQLQITYSNGEEKCTYSDGTVVTTDVTGQKLILLPNGQKEVRKYYKEYFQWYSLPKSSIVLERGRRREEEK